MSGHVSSFNNIEIGEFRYVFIVFCWNDYQTSLTEQLEKQFKPLGDDLGPYGLVVKAFKEANYDTGEEITKKDWPEAVRNRFEDEQDPIMLIINKDFKEFDPKKHPWSIIWFSDHYKQPDRIYRIFGELARKTRKGEDIFQYLDSNNKKNKFKKLAEYVDYKPQFFGFSIDVKAIFQDLTGLGN